MCIRAGARIHQSTFRIPKWNVPQSAIRNPQSGISLIELIIFIVVVSLALAGLLLVLNTTTKSSADPLVRKQAIAAAYSLLEEIELQDFSPASGVICTLVAPQCNNLSRANRSTTYHTVKDYDGFSTVGIYSLTDVLLLTNFNASVTVAGAALNGTAGATSYAAASSVQINVTVAKSDGSESIIATGYRTRY